MAVGFGGSASVSRTVGCVGTASRKLCVRVMAEPKCLKDMRLSDITLGMRVRSLKTGSKGTVIEILPEDREDFSVRVRWDHGVESIAWHFWLHSVVQDGV